MINNCAFTTKYRETFSLFFVCVISVVQPTYSATFGHGTGPIILNNIQCTGNELQLIDCLHDGIGISGTCVHTDDAGVICQESTYAILIFIMLKKIIDVTLDKLCINFTYLCGFDSQAVIMELLGYQLDKSPMKVV